MAIGQGLLLKILSGEEESSRLLLSDTAEVNGLHLLKWSLYQMAQRYNDTIINIVITNRSPEQWKKNLSRDITQRLNVRFLNVFDSSLSKDLFIFTEHSKDSAILVIDNLSTMLLQYTCSEVCQLIHTLSSHYRVVFGILHNDIHDETTINSLNHVMTSVITLSSNGDTSNGAVSSIIHKRKSGMIIRKDEIYEMTAKYDLQLLEQHKTITTTTTTENNAQSDSSTFDHPSANLTFDLTLTKQERERRSQVVLPYTKKIKAGSIIYEPDENDDLDDSDPDDDLNI